MFEEPVVLGSPSVRQVRDGGYLPGRFRCASESRKDIESAATSNKKLGMPSLAARLAGRPLFVSCKAPMIGTPFEEGLMQRLSILACELVTLAFAGSFTLGCGGGGKSGAGVDAGHGDGGMSVGFGGVGGRNGTGGAVGTGGSSTTSTGCDTFNPCGGSVVGVWKLPATLLCGPSVTTLANCPLYTKTDNFQETGTLTFRADGSTQSVMTADGTSSISYPSTCATGSTCPIGTSAPDHGLSVSCGESTPGTCRCDYVYDNAVITNKEGSYTTSGGDHDRVLIGIDFDLKPSGLLRAR